VLPRLASNSQSSCFSILGGWGYKCVPLCLLQSRFLWILWSHDLRKIGPDPSLFSFLLSGWNQPTRKTSKVPVAQWLCWKTGFQSLKLDCEKSCSQAYPAYAQENSTGTSSFLLLLLVSSRTLNIRRLRSRAAPLECPVHQETSFKCNYDSIQQVWVECCWQARRTC
jgi:hypothetical protein